MVGWKRSGDTTPSSSPSFVGGVGPGPVGEAGGLRGEIRTRCTVETDLRVFVFVFLLPPPCDTVSRHTVSTTVPFSSSVSLTVPEAPSCRVRDTYSSTY